MSLRERQKDALALLFIATVWAIFTLPWLLEGNVIPFDAKNHFYAMIRFLAASLHSGESPFWSPFHYAGFPMVADPQSVIFTPSLWLPALVSAEPSMALVDFTQLLHLLWIGMAAYGFARARNWYITAAIVVGLTAMLGGAITIRLEHVLMIVSMMWFWVALWRLELAMKLGGFWRGLIFGIVLAFMLIDRDHVAYLGAWVLLSYWITRTLPNIARVGLLDTARLNTPVLLGGVVSIALAALPILLLLQLAENSNRPEFGYLEASWQSLHPAALLTFFMAEVFGPLRGEGYWGPASVGWGGDPLKMHRGMLHLYMGTLPVLVVCWLGLIRGGLLRSGNRFFAILTVTMLLYMLGRYTPVFKIFYNVVPGVDLFRRPADAAFLFGVGVSLLTGSLLDDYLKRGERTGGYFGVVILDGVLLLVFMAAILLALTYETVELLLPAVGAFIGLSAFFFISMLNTKNSGTRRMVAIFTLLGVCAGDLITYSSGLNNNTRPPDAYRVQEKPFDEEVFAFLREELKELDPSGAPWRIETLGLGPTAQNIGQAAGFQNVLGYNPIRLASFTALIAPDMQNNASNRRGFGTLMFGYDSPMANALGLRYLVLGTRIETVEPKGRERESSPDFSAFSLLRTFTMGTRTLHVYRNENAEARAILQRPGTVQITNYSNDEIRLNVQSDTANCLILREFFYPGWDVYVNGKQMPITRNNGLFRSVETPTGTSEVIFRFSPFNWSNLKIMAAGILFPNDQNLLSDNAICRRQT